VDDALRVHGRNRAEHLLPVEADEVLVDLERRARGARGARGRRGRGGARRRASRGLLRALAVAPLEEARKVDVAVLEDDEDEPLAVVDLCVDELDDVGAPAERLEQRDLVDEARRRLGVAPGEADPLERKDLAVGRHDLVDARGAAAPDALELCVRDAAHDDC
jgi:hypothetical protein